jgi:hypothetical protein
VLLETTQIGVPRASHALAWRWPLHGAAHQSAGLSVGHTPERPKGFFEMLNHPTHAATKAGSRFMRRVGGAFSWGTCDNAMISKIIHLCANCQLSPVALDRGRGVCAGRSGYKERWVDGES